MNYEMLLVQLVVSLLVGALGAVAGARVVIAVLKADVQHIKDGLKNMEGRLGYRIEYNLERVDAVDARLDSHVERYHFPGVR